MGFEMLYRHWRTGCHFVGGTSLTVSIKQRHRAFQLTSGTCDSPPADWSEALDVSDSPICFLVK